MFRSWWFNLALSLAIIVAGLIGFGVQATAAQTEEQSYACPTISNTPNFIEVYGQVTIDGAPAPIGTVVEGGAWRSGYFTPFGCFVVHTPGYYGYMRVYGEDVATFTPGMWPNEYLTLRLNGEKFMNYTGPVLFQGNYAMIQRDLQVSTAINSTTAFLRSGATLTVHTVDPYGEPVGGGYKISIVDPMGRVSTGQTDSKYGEEVVYGLNPTGVFLVKLEVEPTYVSNKVAVQSIDDRELKLTFTMVATPNVVGMTGFEAFPVCRWWNLFCQLLR